MTTTFENYRRHLIGIAHRITGSYTDAEDVVSEVWLRWHQATGINNPDAWLRTVTTRVALDKATANDSARTTYIGPWLPDVVEHSPSPEDSALTSENLDRALLRLLQEHSPTDRAVLVLKEVAGFSATDIAPIVGLTPAAVRQRLRRTRMALATSGDVTCANHSLLEELKTQLSAGNLESFMDLLAPGAVLWSDANGTSNAARRPVQGKERISRFLTGIITKYGMPEFAVVPAHGGPALLAISTDLTRALTLEITDGNITGIQIQLAPEKLRLRDNKQEK